MRVQEVRLTECRPPIRQWNFLCAPRDPFFVPQEILQQMEADALKRQQVRRPR